MERVRVEAKKIHKLFTKCIEYQSSRILQV